MNQSISAILLLCSGTFCLVRAFPFATQSVRRRSLCNHLRAQHNTLLDMMNHDEEEENSTGNHSDDVRLTDEELLAQTPEWDDTVARFNSVHLSGRIGGEPKVRHFDDGKIVLNLSLAVKRKYNALERKYLNLAYGKEETDWYGLEMWGQAAEFASKFVDSGMRVSVIGTLQVDQWTDKETGEARSRIKVAVRDFDIMETRAESETRRSKQGGSSQYYSGGDYGTLAPESFFDN